MIDKLIKMAKNGMFDTAFLLAENNNLYNELFNTLKGKYDITFEELKELVSLKEKENIDYLDICYNIETLKLYVNHGIYVSDIYTHNINITKNIHLKILMCCMLGIKKIDLQNNTKLIELDCSANNLKTLDTTNNPLLETLECESNCIKTLDVSNNFLLERLICDENKIKHLNLYKNKKLHILSCKRNQIETLNLVNNQSLKYLYCTDNPNLKTIILNKIVKNNITIEKDIYTEIIYE